MNTPSGTGGADKFSALSTVYMDAKAAGLALNTTVAQQFIKLQVEDSFARGACDEVVACLGDEEGEGIVGLSIIAERAATNNAGYSMRRLVDHFTGCSWAS